MVVCLTYGAWLVDVFNGGIQWTVDSIYIAKWPEEWTLTEKTREIEGLLVMSSSYIGKDPL